MQRLFLFYIKWKKNSNKIVLRKYRRCKYNKSKMNVVFYQVLMKSFTSSLGALHLERVVFWQERFYCSA